MNTTVLLVDDHEQFRQALADMIEAAHGVELVASVGDWRAAMDVVAAARPDVIVTDLPDDSAGGLGGIRSILARDPALRVLVVSMHTDRHLRQQARAIGALGLVSKESAPEEVLGAIRAAARGESTDTPDGAEARDSESTN